MYIIYLHMYQMQEHFIVTVLKYLNSVHSCINKTIQYDLRIICYFFDHCSFVSGRECVMNKMLLKGPFDCKKKTPQNFMD